MSYHRDEHWFDFDSDLIDASCPMTDLDKQISKFGTETVLERYSQKNKGKKPMKLLDYYHTDPEGKYVDYCTDIAGNTERGIRFILSYVIKDDRFYANIAGDGDDSLWVEGHIESIEHEVAKFMIGEEEYNKLKKINQEEKKTLVT